MGQDKRVTARKTQSYATKSQRTKLVKTPGSKLVVQYKKKQGTIPKCGDCKLKLRGIKAYRPYAMKRTKKHERTVSRVYGGSRCHQCVRNRIVRAFLVEEQRIVKKVVQQAAKQEKAAPKKEEAKKSKK